jgi:NAD(P)-dependent dehydrogenase (short-subunit alcohol dehydrogenase family)
MDLQGRVAVVTGGGGGIGRALCRRFAAEGARAVVAADLDLATAQETARLVRTANAATTAVAVRTDVSVDAEVIRLVEETLGSFGAIDLFAGNAGIAVEGGIETSLELWERTWAVNVMANVYAARAVVPAMVARGEGYVLITASAAGLLTAMGAATYAVTKSAAVALAEWLAITYGDVGIRVSCLCPQGVQTAMLSGMVEGGNLLGTSTIAGGGVLSPEEVAEAVIQGLADERFLILPHPEVADYVRRKADNPDRWLGGMRKLQRRLTTPATDRVTTPPPPSD